jgi:hypothetical protein
MKNTDTRGSGSMLRYLDHRGIVLILNALPLFLGLLRFPDWNIFLDAMSHPWETHRHFCLVVCLRSRDTELLLFRVFTKH